MRVRITQELRGSVDGILLARLSKGHVYDVYTSLACYLLSEEMADLALNEEPIAIRPIENRMLERPTETRKGIILPRSMAADRSRRKKPRRR